MTAAARKLSPENPDWFFPFKEENWKHYKRRMHGEILRRKNAGLSIASAQDGRSLASLKAWRW